VTLLALIDQSLCGAASRAALTVDVAGGTQIEYTFADLEQRSNQLAALCQARGLSTGDRIAFLLPNCVEIVVLWLACVKLGVIAVPINVLYQSREILHVVRDARPDVVITTAERAADFPDDVAIWDVIEITRALAASDRSIGRPTSVTQQPGFSDETPLALVYTSGTTGASKGAILTHGNFASNARVLNASWEITSADRMLTTLPLFHVHGLGNALHCWLLSGCHMRLTARFEASRAEEWFSAYQPTVFFGVPTMFTRLLEVDASAARAIGARARLFVCGSAPLPPQLLLAFQERFGHVILERYGMTETLMIASNPYHGERRVGSVGRALPGVTVRIVDDAGVDVSDGVSGELWVRGPNVSAGYWNRPEATVGAFSDGWFRTGDIGVRTADGYITLEGRRSDLIISGGFNIYPREIEEILLEQPGVREAAVAGIADRARGEVPVAFLVCDDAVDTSAIDHYLRTQLASFKIPRAYRRVDALPRTALGKVQKHLLPPVSLTPP
jgi:malonyl-CoA/methylmalonyl-CoA synthetase